MDLQLQTEVLLVNLLQARFLFAKCEDIAVAVAHIEFAFAASRKSHGRAHCAGVGVGQLCAAIDGVVEGAGLHVERAGFRQRRVAHSEAVLERGRRGHLAWEQTGHLAGAVGGCTLQHGREFVLRVGVAHRGERIAGCACASHLLEELIAAGRCLEGLFSAV